MFNIVGQLFLVALLWFGALAALLLWPLKLLGGAAAAKETVRGIDGLCNAFLGGLSRESLSSRSWREQIKPVIWLTDLVEQGHCREANRHEQPIVDVINS